MTIRNIGSNMSEYKGCGKCKGCWMRFVKLVIVIQACQGLSDDICLPLFDYAFNEHPKFKEYTVEDWLTIEPKKLLAIYIGCSCGYKNCANTLTVLEGLHQRYRSKEDVPKMKWWYTETTTQLWYHFRGFAKKSTLLITIGTYGYCNNLGIATDSHVAEKAVLLDWLCKKYGDIKEKKYPPRIEATAANMMLEELFDEDVWMLVNDTIGAIAQYDNIDTNIIDNALQNLSTVHRKVIHRFRYGKHEVMEPIA